MNNSKIHEQEKGSIETESPIYREIRIIGERLAGLEKTSQVLVGRLSPILSEAKPEEEKKDCEGQGFASSLEQKLSSISSLIDSNTRFLQTVIDRITV